MNGQALPRRVLVGIIDSGLDAIDQNRMPVVAARRFVQDGDGMIQAAAVDDDALGHGSGIAQILLESNPEIDLLIAQVFTGKRQCSSAQVAAALDWLVSAGVAVINMSCGINKPDATLRLACERASAAGAILVAAAPARGAPTFPAAYPFCIAVSGDARCNRDQISWLGTAAVDFGAHPFLAPGNPQSGGASFAVARICARIARLLSEKVAAPEIRTRLQAQCNYHGPEFKPTDIAQVSAVIGPHP
ncbi:MAG: S8 family serine peptidase [Proteobacteria bacterium]|nr:S8 family serine peptidase [Pseudomonadota bacterium]